MKTIIISKTAVIRGRGSDPYKSVTHLTPDERAAIRAGKTVLVADENQHPQCAPFKRVYEYKGRFYHRNATPRQCAIAKATGGSNL